MLSGINPLLVRMNPGGHGSDLQPHAHSVSLPGSLEPNKVQNRIIIVCLIRRDQSGRNPCGDNVGHVRY